MSPSLKAAQAGLVLAGLAAAAVVPDLPLRHSVFSLPLLASLLLWRPDSHRDLKALVIAYIWFWNISCVVAVTGSARLEIALALMTAGLILTVPQVVTDLRKRPLFSTCLDGGVAAGAVLLSLMAAAIATISPDDRALPPIGLLLLAPGSVMGYLAARAVGGSDLRSGLKWPAAAGLAAAAISSAATLGLWAYAGNRAQWHGSEGRIGEALAWAEIEESKARSLGSRWFTLAALRRRAALELENGTGEGRREALIRLLEEDPQDFPARRALLREAMKHEGETGETAALDHFRRLPDGFVSSRDASRLVPVAARERDWKSLARLWKIGGREKPLSELPLVVQEEAGHAFFFMGEKQMAEVLLRRAVGMGKAGWKSIRILSHIYLESERPARAHWILQDAPFGEKEEERTYLLALSARMLGRHQEEEFMLREATKIDPEHPAARRRLRELESWVDNAPWNVTGGVRFEGALTLVDCRVEGSGGAGETLTLAFEWEAEAPVNPSWKVFVHVRQAVPGGAFFQGDHEFRDVGRPADEWGIGSGLAYEIDIPVPPGAPAGEYLILLGLWDGQAKVPPRMGPGPQREMKISHHGALLLTPAVPIGGGRENR